MIYCKDNKELHLSGTADLLLAQATAIAINVLKVACAGRKDEMRKEIVEKFVELVVKDVCGEKSKVSDGNCLIKVENGITTMAGNAKDILEALEICVSVVVKTLAGEDEDKAGSLVCEFISHATERVIRDDVSILLALGIAGGVSFFIWAACKLKKEEQQNAARQ